MNYKHKNFLIKGLSLFLTALITFSSVNTTAYAAPARYENSISYQQGLPAELENQVQEAYKALLTAYKTGKQSDYAIAYNLISKLNPTQSVRLFVLKYKDYYKQNYLKNDFAYFNVDKYILAHPELNDSNTSVSENRENALNYYLNYGIYNGDSSYTDFDPIIAIVVHPTECLKAIIADSQSSADGLIRIREAYTLAEGINTTIGYDLVASYNLTSGGIYTSNDGILYIQQIINSSDDESDIPVINPSDDNTSDTPEDIDPIIDGGMGGPDDYEFLVNNKARKDISGFKLHFSPSEITGSDDFSSMLDDNGYLKNLDLSYTKSNDYKYSIDYLANNYYDIANKNASTPSYSKIKDNAKYTVMIYLCGTDLESDHEEGSKLLAETLKGKYDTDKVNVLVCAGGTKSWSADDLKENNNVQCSIYYLNPNGVSAGPDSSANEIINSDSLVKLTQIKTPIEVGQSELLLGFMDMAYELFPADNYWLSLWNHGGGSKSGICFSDPLPGNSEITSEGLSLARIEEALASSMLYKDDKKLDILSFDACMMAGIEEAHNFSRYADYMIGSAEVSSGDLGYGSAISYINNLPDGAKVDNKEVAKKAAIEYIQDKKDNYLNAVKTESVYDLSKIDAINEKNEDLALCLSGLLSDDSNAYRTIRKSAVRSKAYGADNDAPAYGYLDYYDFLIKLEAYLQDLGNTSSVKYTKSRCDRAIANIESIINTQFILDVNTSYGKQNDINCVAEGANAMSLKEVATAYRDKSDLVYNKVFLNSFTALNIYFPLAEDSYQYLSRNGYDSMPHSDSMGNYLDEGVLHNYSYMLRQIDDMANSEAELARLKKVATALANSSSTDNGMMDGLTLSEYTYNDNNETKTEHVLNIEFKKDYSKTEYANDGIHTDPLTDFIDVVKDVNILSLMNTKSYRSDGEESTDANNYDVIIASKKTQPNIGISSDVTYQDSKLEEETKLSFDFGPNNLVGYLIEGFTAILNGTTYESSGPEAPRYQDWGHMTSQKDKDNSTINYDSFGEGYNEKNVYIFDGRYYYLDNNNQETSEKALLAFTKKDTNYSYLGVFSKNTDENNTVSYTKADNINAISFDHYTVIDGKIVNLEDYVNEQNSSLEGNYEYLKTPIHIIDGTNTPTISELVVDGLGIIQDKSKNAVEINVIVPVIGEERETFVEESIVYTGENGLYVDSSGTITKAQYEDNECIGVTIETPTVTSDLSGDTDSDATRVYISSTEISEEAVATEEETGEQEEDNTDIVEDTSVIDNADIIYKEDEALINREDEDESLNPEGEGDDPEDDSNDSEDDIVDATEEQ